MPSDRSKVGLARRLWEIHGDYGFGGAVHAGIRAGRNKRAMGRVVGALFHL
jgi:hypothetical protein